MRSVSEKATSREGNVSMMPPHNERFSVSEPENINTRQKKRDHACRARHVFVIQTSSMRISDFKSRKNKTLVPHLTIS